METVCYTIQEFCKAHRISESYFYLLDKNGLAPRMMKLGRKKIISIEAAADWRRLAETDGIVKMKFGNE